MNKENSKIEGAELIFPEETVLILEKILKNYGLIKTQENGIEKITESLSSPNVKIKPEERIKIFESLPGTKLSKLVKEYAEKKIPLEKLPLKLKESLNITQKDAEKMAEELKTTLLDLIKTVKTTELTKEKETPSIESLKSEPEIKPSVSFSKEEKSSFKKDGYREPVE